MQRMEDLAVEARRQRSHRFSKPSELVQAVDEMPLPPRTAPHNPHQLETWDRWHVNTADRRLPADRLSKEGGLAKQESWEAFNPHKPPSELEFFLALLPDPFASEDGLTAKRRAVAYGLDTFGRGLANGISLDAANPFAATMNTWLGDGDYETNLAVQRDRDRYDASHLPITSFLGQLATAWGRPRHLIKEILPTLLAGTEPENSQVNKQRPWRHPVIRRPKKD